MLRSKPKFLDLKKMRRAPEPRVGGVESAEGSRDGDKREGSGLLYP